MKYRGFSIPFVLAVTIALWIYEVHADFHILRAGEIGFPPNTIACPSDFYNCYCFMLGQDQVEANFGSIEDGNFQLAGGLCGITQPLDFYRAADGHFDFYISGGDGSVQGSCYDNSASGGGNCGKFVHSLFEYQEALVCYSYICNP